MSPTASTDADTSTNEFDGTIEKDVENGEPVSAFEPIRSTSRTRSLHPTRSCQSTGGEDGYSVRRDDSEDGHDEDEPPETKEFEVKWDNESDPMNPRCMKKRRKWLIVIIVAACSLCV